MIFKFVFEIVAVSGNNKLVIVLIASKYIYIYISVTDAQVYTPFICPKEVCKNQI